MGFVSVAQQLTIQDNNSGHPYNELIDVCDYQATSASFQSRGPVAWMEPGRQNRVRGDGTFFARAIDQTATTDRPAESRDTSPPGFGAILDLVERTGQAIRADKHGALPAGVPPILAGSGWERIDTVRHFRRNVSTLPFHWIHWRKAAGLWGGVGCGASGSAAGC